MFAAWAMGMVNCREYWMNAWMSPMAIARRVTRMPPATATATYPMLLMNVIIGNRRPEMNCARQLAS